MDKFKASIDIGSNSVNLLIADISDGIKPIFSDSQVTGLGRDLDKNKKFLDIAMTETMQVLREYLEIAKKRKIEAENIIVTATEASRVSSNAAVFFKKIQQKLGLEVVTISGEGEAYYSAIGLLCDKKITDQVVTIMDIGGASTELIQVNSSSRQVLNSFSMPVGVVRMNNWKLENKQNEKLMDVLTKFNDQLELVKSKKLYCVAGTMTSVANMHLDNRDFVESDVNGHQMSSLNFNQMCEQYADSTPEQFLIKYPFLGKRSQTIYAGLLLASTIFTRLDVEDIYVSTFGIRYGTLLKGSIEDKYVWKRSEQQPGHH